MVFTTIVNLARSRGPDEMWRKRKIFKLASHFIGRRRNCYSITIRAVHRMMQYVAKGRDIKKNDLKQLWENRIAAGCDQFGIDIHAFREGLSRNGIMLNRKTLADLSAWEPRTFEALALTSRERAAQDGMRVLDEKQADNKITYYNDETKQELKVRH